MGLKVYNTLYRKKQIFKPIEDKKVGMYVCGPTVYNYISIGNARPIIVFDMVRNYLEHTGLKVDYVQNITDIEDKIIKKANEENVDFKVITDRYIKAFLEDIKKLDVGKFIVMPLASEMLQEIISIIKKIIENGYAYIVDGNVYFDVTKFKSYGKLSGQKTDEMQIQDNDTYRKKSKIDFALWKSAKPGEPCWESPWGNGRPGWHIECSAMSIKFLNFGIDIHGGGIDLVFPHHENEIAQSEAAFPEKGDFVKYWMHNGMIEVKEEKMSKSRGLKKDWILRNLLEKYSSNIIKMYILSTHYRSPLEFSKSKLEEAKKALERILNSLRNIKFLISSNDKVGNPEYDLNNFNTKDDILASKIFDYIRIFKEEFKESMDDDFNSAKAIGSIFDLIRNINSIIQSSDFKMTLPIKESLALAYKVIMEHGRVLGFDFEKKRHKVRGKTKSDLVLDNEEINDIINLRNEARRERDFKRADEIRKKLYNMGVILEDRKEGTIWKRER